jgi:Nif-specific regulatory protein
MTEQPEAPLVAQDRGDVTVWTMYSLSKILTTPERLETTLARVLELLASLLGMRNGLIVLVDDDGTPETVVGAGWSEPAASTYLELLPSQAVATVVSTRAPLVVERIRGDPRFPPPGPLEDPDADLAFLGVPILDQTGLVGTLSVERERNLPVRLEEDVRLLTLIANLVGQAVRLQRLISRDRERLIEEQARLGKLLERHGVARPPEEAMGIVGDSQAIRAVTEKLRIVARSNSTVLLRGESGTGKELFAQALHRLSPRKDRPFVAVNCAALPESVLESELFGHEKGAFTNAGAQRRGRFELADGGTLFLDEIGDISPAFQAKLLRVLQEGELERVGGSATLKVDVRLVAATNRDLEDAVARGHFRADLYYRISVVPIFLPPLRTRKTDIAPLAREFLRRFNDEHSTELVFDDRAVGVLSACNFPGNVRELENCVRRTATFARSKVLGADDFACTQQECLSATLWKQPGQGSHHAVPTAAAAPGAPLGPASPPPPAPTRLVGAPAVALPAPGPATSDAEHGERERLIAAMEAAGWVQARAARMLGLTPRQVGYALKKHNVPMKKF